MSVLICSTIYDGCGYVGEGHMFDGNGDFIICPSCHDDHAFQLTDENFDRLVNDSNRDEAREMLDRDHAAIHGGHLEFCVKEGYISKKKLTLKQKKELGL